jgi:hypothetical protein
MLLILVITFVTTAIHKDDCVCTLLYTLYHQSSKYKNNKKRDEEK